MKKYSVIILTLVIAFVSAACSVGPGAAETAYTKETETNPITSEATQSETKVNEMKVKVSINGKTFSATLADNAAAKELYEIIKSEGLTVELSDYSGFEKVGRLGHTLSANDKQTTTHAGDLVLYQSNQLVMFYGSNSWSYTRLGSIDDLSGWEEALGSGNITAEFSVG
ncbi:MAG: hypothetical protein K6C14_03335 [Eubacterium sp.]|nr:hypothetical protein [Eubacterium sp.]